MTPPLMQLPIDYFPSKEFFMGIYKNGVSQADGWSIPGLMFS